MTWFLAYLYLSGAVYAFAVEARDQRSWIAGVLAGIFWPIFVPLVYGWRLLLMIRI